MSALRVLLPTVRPEDLVRFYVEGLGLAIQRSWDDPGNRGWLLRVGDEAYIEVLAGNDRYPAGAVGAIQLAIGVDDVDRAVAAAAALDAPVASAPADMPWGLRSATIRDPDGNLVNLFAALRA